MSVVKDLLAAARTYVDAQMATADPSQAIYWTAADSALKLLEDNADALQGIGVFELRKLIGIWADPESAAGADLAYLKDLTPDEILDAMRTGRADMQAAVKAQQDRNALLVQLGKDLLPIGANMLLAVLKLAIVAAA